jgi:hypothetical protein
MKPEQIFKWSIYSSLLVAVLVIAAIISVISCKKEPTDYRDQFYGRWRGPWKYETPYYHQEGMYCYRHFIPGHTETEMIVNSNWRSQVVDVFCSSYSYQAFEISGASCGVMSIVTVTGDGWLRNDTLFEQGTLSFMVNLVEYKGSWSAWMVKD